MATDSKRGLFRKPPDRLDLLRRIAEHLPLEKVVGLDMLDFCRCVHYTDGMTAIHDEENVEIGEVPRELVDLVGRFYCARRTGGQKVKGTSGLIFVNEDGTPMTPTDVRKELDAIIST